MTIELEHLLDAETYERLQAEAERQHAALPELVRDVLASYVQLLDDEPEIEDTPDEVVLANFRQAWREMLEGKTIPADEALAELRAKRDAKRKPNPRQIIHEFEG